MGNQEVEENPKPQSAPPQPLHRAVTDEDDENVKQLQDCASLYFSLEECLLKTNRNWKICQKEVRALKVCRESWDKARRS